MLILLALISCEPEAVDLSASLPKETKPAEAFPVDRVLKIELKPDQTARIDTETLTFTELRTYLSTNSDRIDRVQLVVGGEQPQADVVAVLDSLAHAGIESVTFIEAEDSRPGPNQ